jgi:hypothetical protein
VQKSPLLAQSNLIKLYFADPANLKKVWEEYKRIEAGGDRQEGFRRQFPESDWTHIVFRLSILQMVQTMPKGREMLAPWTHEGKLDDAILKAFAIVPMKQPQPGENALTSLVDLDESIRLIITNSTQDPSV